MATARAFFSKSVELLRAHRVAIVLESVLGVAEIGEHVEHVALELLHQLQRHVEKVAGAAGGVEDTGRAKLLVKGADHLLRGGVLAFEPEADRLAFGGFPIGAERLDDGRHHQPLDIGARRIVGAEFGALLRVERLLKQRAKNRRLDVPPVAAGGLGQKLELVLGDLDDRLVVEEPAVELADVLLDGGGMAARVHEMEEVPRGEMEARGLAAIHLDEALKALLREAGRHPRRTSRKCTA